MSPRVYWDLFCYRLSVASLRSQFEILEHPADIGFRAFGDSLPNLFENAALALLSIAAELNDVQPREQFQLEAAAADREALLVAWLSEVLYWYDGKRIALRSVHVESLTPERIVAVGWGEARDVTRHHAKIIVKAVTWHQLRIYEQDGRWIAEVYLDI